MEITLYYIIIIISVVVHSCGKYSWTMTKRLANDLAKLQQGTMIIYCIVCTGGDRSQEEKKNDMK